MSGTSIDQRGTPIPFVDRRRRPAPGPGATAVQILVSGDQPLYRAALSSLVERDLRFRVAAESTNDRDEVRRVLEHSDVQMAVVDCDVAPAGRDITALEELLDVVAPRPALVVSSALDAEAWQRAVRHGVAGVVFKTSGPDVLLSAIESALRGQVFLERAVLPQMFDDSHTRREECGEKAKIDLLTAREREIMRVACTGVTNKQIASQLSISDTTVRHHLASIFSKLGVSTRAELVVYSYRHRLAAPLA